MKPSVTKGLPFVVRKRDMNSLHELNDMSHEIYLKLL